MIYYKDKRCKLYKEDNLEVLKQLPDNYIDLIYCDILYNTGRKFKDYDDNLGTPQEAISWYEPRLHEMKRVLKETGSIYLHCDYHLSHRIRVLLDEVFSEKNFINEIIWEYPKGIKNSSRKEICNHDNIFKYSKSNQYVHNQVFIEYTEKQISRFKYVDEDGNKFYYDTRRKNGEKVRVKVFLKKEGTPLGDVWYINFEQGSKRLGYDTQKPKALLERIIKASSNSNDIVADFFMGSGTTGEVAVELGRRFIGCDISERACEITKERILKIE